MSATDEARKTHPLLTNSVVKQFNRYIQWSTEYSIVGSWIRELYGGVEIYDRLSDAILRDDEVLGLDDQACHALIPVLWDVQAPATFVSNGGKAKQGRGAAGPSILARLEDDTLIFATWLGQGYSLEVLPGSRIVSATLIVWSRLFYKIPALQLGSRSNDGSVEYWNFAYGEMYPAAVREQIEMSLTRGYPSHP